MSEDPKLWSYIRNELDEAGRAAIEDQCATDAAFRTEIAEARVLDQKLRQHFREGDVSVERLIDKIEMELEASTTQTSSKPWIRFPKQALGGLLALAASAVLLLGISYPGTPLQFGPVSIEGARSKGEAVEPLARRYSEEELGIAVEAFWHTLNTTYRQTQRYRGISILLTGRRQLQVETTIEELRAGKLYCYVEVSDAGIEGSAVRFARYWNSLGDFEEDAGSFSEEIVQTLGSTPQHNP